MAETIRVIGIGPGTMEYLPPVARAAVEGADILVGGPRALAMFSQLGKEEYLIGKNLKEAADFIRDRKDSHKVAVLVSGDPGFHSLLAYLKRTFPGEQFEVIPGLSSVQLAFARIGEFWHDAALISLHGRELSALQLYTSFAKIAVLTDPEHSPAAIARFWLSHGLPDCRAYVCANLGYEDEKVLSLSVSQMAETAGVDNSVVVMINE